MSKAERTALQTLEGLAKTVGDGVKTLQADAEKAEVTTKGMRSSADRMGSQLDFSLNRANELVAKELEDLVDWGNKLQANLDENKKALEKAEETAALVPGLESDVARLKDEAERAEEVHKRTLEDTQARLNREHDEAMSAARKEHDKEVTEVRDELLKAKNEHVDAMDKLREEHRAYKSERDMEVLKLNEQVMTMVRQTTEAMDKHAQECDRLSKEAQREADNAAKLRVELEKVQKEAITKEHEHMNITRDLDTKHREIVKEMEEQRRELENELERVTKEYKDTAEQMKQERERTAKLEEDVNSWIEKLKKAETEKEEEIKKRESIGQQLENEKHSLESKYSELETRYKDKDTEVGQLSDKLSTVVQQMASAMEQHSADMSRIASGYQDSEGRAAKTAEFVSELESRLQAKEDTHKNTLQELHGQYGASLRQLQEVTEKVGEERGKELSGRVSELEGELKRYREQLDEKENETRRMRESDADMAQTRESIKHLEENLRSTEMKLSQAVAENAENASAVLRSRIAELEAAARDSKAEKESLQRSLDMANEKIMALEQEAIAAAESSTREIAARVAEIEQKRAEAETAMNEARVNAEKTEEALKRASARADEAEKAAEQQRRESVSRADMEKLEKQLHDAMMEKSEMAKEAAQAHIDRRDSVIRADAIEKELKDMLVKQESLTQMYQDRIANSPKAAAKSPSAAAVAALEDDQNAGVASPPAGDQNAGVASPPAGATSGPVAGTNPTPASPPAQALATAEAPIYQSETANSATAIFESPIGQGAAAAAVVVMDAGAAPVTAQMASTVEAVAVTQAVASNPAVGQLGRSSSVDVGRSLGLEVSSVTEAAGMGITPVSEVRLELQRTQSRLLELESIFETFATGGEEPAPAKESQPPAAPSSVLSTGIYGSPMPCVTPPTAVLSTGIYGTPMAVAQGATSSGGASAKADAAASACALSTGIYGNPMLVGGDAPAPPLTRGMSVAELKDLVAQHVRSKSALEEECSELRDKITAYEDLLEQTVEQYKRDVAARDQPGYATGVDDSMSESGASVVYNSVPHARQGSLSSIPEINGGATQVKPMARHERAPSDREMMLQQYGLSHSSYREKLEESIAYLKQEVLPLNREGERTLDRILKKMEAGVRAKTSDPAAMFKTAQMTIKREVVILKGEQYSGMEWTLKLNEVNRFPKHALNSIFKSAQELVVMYDCLSDEYKNQMKTVTEIIHNTPLLLTLCRYIRNNNLCPTADRIGNYAMREEAKRRRPTRPPSPGVSSPGSKSSGSTATSGRASTVGSRK